MSHLRGLGPLLVIMKGMEMGPSLRVLQEARYSGMSKDIFYILEDIDIEVLGEVCVVPDVEGQMSLGVSK